MSVLRNGDLLQHEGVPSFIACAMDPTSAMACRAGYVALCMARRSSNLNVAGNGAFGFSCSTISFGLCGVGTISLCFDHAARRPGHTEYSRRRDERIALTRSSE